MATFLLPDTGSSAPVTIIEIAVKEGDNVTEGQTLMTLESDKATIDVPAPHDGKLEKLLVKKGDQVSTGSPIAEISGGASEKAAEKTEEKPAIEAKANKAAETKESSKKTNTAQSSTFALPDTGSSAPVTIIELLVKDGDSVTEGQTLMTLESDKATIDVPAPHDGIIEKLLVKKGDQVSTGSPIAEISGGASEKAAEKTETAAPAKEEKSSNATEATKTATPDKTAAPISTAAKSAADSDAGDEVYAGPAVRRLARSLGVNLAQVKGSGERGRILQDDVHHFVKQAMQSGGTATTGTGLPKMPTIDFSQWGPIESKPLLRIKKITAQNLSRNWLLAPHVTQFEEADITALEAFRKQRNPEFEKQGVKLTPLVFIMKAVVNALKKFPQFNASLDESGENLIFKHYYHIGIAVDTPDGLVVPAIRNVDQKSVSELAKELAEVSAKARNKQLTAQEMQGSTFTISSLGGIGGTAFTPIINLPNVAILGVSKSSIKPQWDGQQFQPRLMLPLSLSYDHRVIDGAEAARFSVYLAQQLRDLGMLDL